MKKIILVLGALILSIWGTFAYTAENDTKHEAKENEEMHDHKENEAHAENEKHEEHADHKEGDSAGHAHGEEGNGEHEEEGGSNIGPEKGITEKAEAGFKLSPEAFRTMEIQTKEFSGGQMKIPLKAIVSIRDEKTIYRLRDGWFKRVKVQILQTNGGSAEISSHSFKDGDQIVVEGVGFVRVAEIYSEEGASHSH